MTIGFKTGPQNWEESKKVVVEDGARMCEIWFDVRKANQYQDMIAWLAAHNVHIGLHYWGLIDNRLKPNLCATDATIRQATITQIKQTIDIAQEIKAIYVNIHPGARALEELNFATRTQKLIRSQFASSEDAWKFLSQSAHLLQDYAQQKNVLLTIETLPGMEPASYDRREPAYDAGNPPLDWLLKLGQQGNWLANDITHTASAISVTNNDSTAMWQGLMDFSQQAAPKTRLIHLNTMTPPFNGTDSHHGLLEEDWAAGAWPNLDQIRQFLNIFKDRDDVFIVPEPRTKVQENYQVIQKLVQTK